MKIKMCVCAIMLFHCLIAKCDKGFLINQYITNNESLNAICDSFMNSNKRSEKDYVMVLQQLKNNIYICIGHLENCNDIIDQIQGRGLWKNNTVDGCLVFNGIHFFIINLNVNKENYNSLFYRGDAKIMIYKTKNKEWTNSCDDKVYFIYEENLVYKLIKNNFVKVTNNEFIGKH